MSLDLVELHIEGGVVTKPSFRHTNSGSAMCKFGVVCHPKWYELKDGTKESMYFTVVSIGKTAEAIYPMIKPGLPIRVEGTYNDGIYRDKLSDEPKIGRLIYATRVRIFVFWKKRKASDNALAFKEELDQITVPNLDELPF